MPDPPNRSLEATLDQVKEWLRSCSTNHLHCRPQPGSTRLPLRILFVGNSLSKPLVRLHESQGQWASYLCLSHCWGTIDYPVKLLKSTLVSWRANDIQVADLPKTFQDAIFVTRRLGFEYLWIDSLCIIQDDPFDWETQSAQMASIYQNSSMTIAALHGNNDQAGLFSPSPELCYSAAKLNENRTSPSFQRSAVKDGRSVYMCGHTWHTIENATPLLDRGWVFQERVLSPRLVHFGMHEIAWECMSGCACECEPTMARYNQVAGPLLESSHLKAYFSIDSYEWSMGYEDIHRWYRIVTYYNNLKLSDERDKFPALSGLVTEFQKWRPAGDKFLAGLWESTFLLDLLWYSPSFAEVPKVYVSPTWSWANTTGPVDFPGSNLFSYTRVPKLCADLVEAYCVPVGKNPVGELKEAYAVLRGKLTPVRLVPDEKTAYTNTTRPRYTIMDNNRKVVLVSSSHERPPDVLYPDYNYHRPSSETRRRQITGGTPLVTLLLVSHIVATNFSSTGAPNRSDANYYRLLLLPRDVPGIYERLGLIVSSGTGPENLDDPFSPFQNEQTAEVMIV